MSNRCPRGLSNHDSKVRALLLITAVVLAAAPAHGQASQKFDLICSLKHNHPDGPDLARYSIDLESGRYCPPNCKAPEAIARIEPDKLILQDHGPWTKRPEDRDDHAKVVVGRADGAFQSTIYMKTLNVFAASEGTCTVGEFTPFPKTLF